MAPGLSQYVHDAIVANSQRARVDAEHLAPHASR
jgi:hypothetical protein